VGRALTRHDTALRAGQHLGDRPGQANALTNLGDARRLTGIIRGRPGTWKKRWASTVTSAAGPARPNALTNLGEVRLLTGDYPGAGRDLEEALGIYR